MDSFELELYLELAKDADNENDIKTADIIDKLIREAAPRPRPKSTPAGSDPASPAPRTRSRRRKESIPESSPSDAAYSNITGSGVQGGGSGNQQTVVNVGTGHGGGAQIDPKKLEQLGEYKEKFRTSERARKAAEEERDKFKAELDEARNRSGPDATTADAVEPPPATEAPPEVKQNWFKRNKGLLKKLGIGSGLLGAGYLTYNAFAKPNVDRSSTTPTGATPPTTVPSAETGAGPDFSQESKRDQASQQRNAIKAQQFIDQYMPQFGTRIKNQRDWYNLALQESNKFTGKARDFNFANTVISFIKRLQAPPIPGGSAPGTF